MKNLGGKVYGEWLYLFKDFYELEKPNEKNFEIFIPLIISSIVTLIYYYVNKVELAVNALSEILVSIIAILIGFTISCITVLIFRKDEEKIKERILYGKSITINKYLIVNFVYVLLVESFTLIFIFAVLFINGICQNKIILIIELFLYVLLLLHIMFTIIRSITSLYFVSMK